mmetsp:Transcript_13868/g.35493  ORF Transcript_13868/g.35493 Transcript_13868/m.35493 type:complete len:203 (+) Transcript_13868:686-1294(+)
MPPALPRLRAQRLVRGLSKAAGAGARRPADAWGDRHQPGRVRRRRADLGGDLQCAVPAAQHPHGDCRRDLLRRAHQHVAGDRLRRVPRRSHALLCRKGRGAAVHDDAANGERASRASGAGAGRGIRQWQGRGARGWAATARPRRPQHCHAATARRQAHEFERAGQHCGEQGCARARGSERHRGRSLSCGLFLTARTPGAIAC